MHIKQGDNARIIAGKDKGKKGKVLRVMSKKELVVVEGVNIVKKHQRRTQGNKVGHIIDKTMPIHISNVAKA